MKKDPCTVCPNRGQECTCQQYIDFHYGKRKQTDRKVKDRREDGKVYP